MVTPGRHTTRLVDPTWPVVVFEDTPPTVDEGKTVGRHVGLKTKDLDVTVSPPV